MFPHEMATVLPKFASKYIALPASIMALSRYIPYAARMVMRPSPMGSQASPTRGKNLFHLGQVK